MPLWIDQPTNLPADPSRFRQISFTSSADGSIQMADVYSPAMPGDAALPLVLAPHPITWTAAEEYHRGYEGYLLGYHAGWYGLADRYGVIVVLPHGHHRRVRGCSLAGSEQIADLAQLVPELSALGYAIDRRRIYACGKSMGGQEALVAAGCHPGLFAAVVAFNPIVDLATWQQDLARTEVEDIREFGLDRMVAEEVGGLPAEAPHAYHERSATCYVEGLSSVPCLFLWSEQDVIVPRQTTHHAYRLYQLIKAASPLSPAAEYNHTRIHGALAFDQTTRWQLHEWCDYELALRWLLMHLKQ